MNGAELIVFGGVAVLIGLAVVFVIRIFKHVGPKKAAKGLVACPGCQTPVSPRATACPHCGEPAAA